MRPSTSSRSPAQSCVGGIVNNHLGKSSGFEGRYIDLKIDSSGARGLLSVPKTGVISGPVPQGCDGYWPTRPA